MIIIVLQDGKTALVYASEGKHVAIMDLLESCENGTYKPKTAATHTNGSGSKHDELESLKAELASLQSVVQVCGNPKLPKP